jgi:virginiamycin B lyase
MIRQVVFAFALGLPIYASAQAPKPASPPPADIPFSRLTADAAVPIALDPGSVESPDAVWTLNRAAGSITRIEAKDNKPAPAIVIGTGACASLAVAFDSVWVPLCGDGTITRVEAKASKVTATLKMKVASADGRIAAGVGSIWAITDRKGVLSRIDPDTNAPVAEIYLAAGAHSVVLSGDALWVTSDADAAKGRLTRVNPHNHEIVETIEVGPKPGRLAVGEGGVWTLNRSGNTVTRVDPGSNKVVATITVGDGLADGEIAVGLGSVWISAPGVPLVRIDPRTNKAVQRFTGAGGGAVLVAHGSLWVAAGPNLTWRLDPLLVSAIRP